MKEVIPAQAGIQASHVIPALLGVTPAQAGVLARGVVPSQAGIQASGVIPAQAGIQRVREERCALLGPRLRGDDMFSTTAVTFAGMTGSDEARFE
jgi:hypothetical protein